MDTDGDDLKAPLLKTPESITVDYKQDGLLQGKKTKIVILKIRGMSRASCATSIESVLRKLNGIESVVVSSLQGQAVIMHRPRLISGNSIKEAIEDLGYEVEDFPEQDVAACRLRIKGMACTSCCESIEQALLMVDGVKKAVVGLALEEAKIHFDPRITDANHLIETIEDAGFGAELITSGYDTDKVYLRLDGIHNADDVACVQSFLKKSQGVNHVDIDLAIYKATISYDPELTGPRSLIQCIQGASHGSNVYHANLYIPPYHRDTERQREILAFRNQFLWSCLFSFPVFLFSMVLPMLHPIGDWLYIKLYNNLTVGVLLRWLLCTPVQLIIGWRFYIGSYHALRRGSANMDVLVALGTNAAYIYSLYIVLKALFSDTFEGQDFFETSAMLVSFILLGKYLEVAAKGKTSDALAKLADLAPDTAFLVDLDGNGNVVSEPEISTQLIQRNDIIKILPGAKVPVDGVVIRGQTHVNESMITGEARPISKRPGDKVIGGTVNGSGFILVKATHVGSETALSQIVQLVEAAQLARAPVQKLADRISKIFVPTIVMAAFLTWLAWFIPGEMGSYPRRWIPKAMDGFELALQFGISVLVVACPCALGLATPTAVMVATGKGASQGVLIKGGNALENAHKVKTVVFDKTGTLTLGRPSVVNIRLFSKISLQKLCDLAAAAEVNSEHPLAKAVVEYAQKLHQLYGSGNGDVMEVTDFKVHSGAGVSGNVGGKSVLVGNKRLMHAFQVPISPDVEEYMSDAESQARTCVLVSVDGIVCGVLAITDPLKPEAEHVVSFLNSMSISSILMTGDNLATATAIANDVGIKMVFAETDPIGKAEKIKELQTKGFKVAMVGDGINDSPALVAADVGMAIGAGTDIAIEAADVVLIKNNLEDVITAIDLSRKTLSRIRLNYVWALGYNILGVPVAAGVLFPFTGIRLPPWLAGACMAASSLSVVCSSLMLQSYKKPLQVHDSRPPVDYSNSV